MRMRGGEGMKRRESGWVRREAKRKVKLRSRRTERKKKKVVTFVVKVEDEQREGRTEERKDREVPLLMLNGAITNEDMRIKDRTDDEETIKDTSNAAGRNERAVEEGELLDAGGLGIVRKVDRKDLRRSESV